MERQLIVVVHGVGVRDAGVVTAQLSAALGSDSGQAPPGEVQWHPRSTDDFMLHEAARYGRRDLLPVFPAHLRRFRRMDPGDPTKVQAERVIADFFWGDISGTGPGAVRVMIGLIKIVLGLSHAIRENAMDVFAGEGRRERVLRWLSREAALLIHGPVVALNIVLFLGLVVTLFWHWLNGRGLMGWPRPELGWFWSEMVIGLGAIGAGYLMLRMSQVFLKRHLASWLAITGAVVILVDLCQAVFPVAMVRVVDWVSTVIFSMPGTGMAAPVGGFVPLAVMLMGLMVCFWALALGIAWVIVLDCLCRGRAAFAASFVPQAISLMSILWMMLMTALWTVALGVYAVVTSLSDFRLPFGLDRDLVLACLRFVTPAAAALIVLALVAAAIHVRKSRAFDCATFKPEDYLAGREALAEKYRLIVGWGLLRVLDGFLVVVTLYFALLVLPTPLANMLDSLNDKVMIVLVAGVGILTVLTVLAGQRGLAAGVAIFADVLAYLNDYSWSSRERDRDIGTGALTVQPRTVMERALGIEPNGGTQRKQGFWLRGRIHARMQMLMDRLITDETPSEIVIVSHSQGTVIALDVIAEHGRDWLGRAGGAAGVKLVTMGSPYTHLFAHYFPSAFKATQDRPALNRGGDDCVLDDWINIFRVDDFVGTHVDRTTNMTDIDVGTGWPREYPVPKNGHTNYWVDANVMPKLQEMLRFDRIGG